MASIKGWITWLLLKLVRFIRLFTYNTLKLRNVVEANGVVRSRQKGPAPSPVKKSLFHMIEERAKASLDNSGDWVFTRNLATGEQLTVAEALRLINKLSVILASCGFKRGDTIHMIVNNHCLYQVIVLAAWKLGGKGSCGDTALKSDTFRFQIQELAANYVVCSPETYSEVKKAVTGLKNVQLLSLGAVLCDDPPPNLLELIESVDDNHLVPVTEELDSDPSSEVAHVFWSSGTTGRPKGICWSHQQCWTTLSAKPLPILKTDIMTLHYFHIMGFLHTLVCFMNRWTTNFIPCEQFSFPLLFKSIQKVQPVLLVMGSHHYVQMSEEDDPDPSLLESVRLIMPTGASVPSVCTEKLKRKFPKCPLFVNLYGQTEAGTVVLGNQEMVGLGPIKPGCTIKFVNVESGEPCQPMEKGEMRFKTNTMSMGYLNQPKSALFDEEGYIKSGDIGYYDAAGTVYYVERHKEVIKYCNNHIAPTEIEDVLQTHPDVLEALVFGMKDPAVQERVSAVVVLKPGRRAEAEDIVQFVNDRVDADYKKLSGKVFFRSALPRNTIGKLLRREMRDWADLQTDRISH